MLTFLILSRRSFSSLNIRKYDLVVVGGGIVGVTAAREILVRNPNLKLAIVEKEDRLAAHQSGHNSGVIHAGIYYTPGSLKAKLCVEGMSLLYKFMNEKNIPHKKVGKLVVATNNLEVDRLLVLWERALKNKCPNIELINADQIKKYEPFCHGIKAIRSPETCIVDYNVVTQYIADDVKNMDGEIFLNFKVDRFAYSSSEQDYPIHVLTNKNQTVAAKYVLTCGGLQSDKIAEMTGCSKYPKIVPFRGEYLLLNKTKCHMIKGNIYPVPDPSLPFLGVHFTPRMDGSVWLGPNAVLALKREGYNWSQINIAELCDSLFYPGFIKLSMKYTKYGISEMIRSFSTSQQIKELQKFIPEINSNDVVRGPAGVRAQALDQHGNLVDDFVFEKSNADNVIAERIIHCRNAPSPGATSSMAIAKMIADEIESQFKLSGEC